MRVALIAAIPRTSQASRQSLKNKLIQQEGRDERHTCNISSDASDTVVVVVIKKSAAIMKRIVFGSPKRVVPLWRSNKQYA